MTEVDVPVPRSFASMDTIGSENKMTLEELAEEMIREGFVGERVADSGNIVTRDQYGVIRYWGAPVSFAAITPPSKDPTNE